jgi:hypothetical protein
METVFSFFTESLHYGFCTTTLLLLLIKKTDRIDRLVLISANNMLLLLRCCLVLLQWGLLYAQTWLGSSSYTQYFFVSKTVGPFWLTFWVPFIGLFILPFVLLNKRWMSKISVSLFLLGTWTISYLIQMIYMISSDNWVPGLQLSLGTIFVKCLFYLLPLTIVYLMLKKFRRN